MTKNTDFETVGAMHQCKKGEMFSTCAHCGAMAGKLNSPCPQYMRNAAAAMTKAAPVAPAPQPAPMPYPTDAQIDAVYEQTMGQHLRSQDAPAVRRFGRAMFLCAWNAAAPKAAPAVELSESEVTVGPVGLNWLISDIRKLPVLRATEFDGEESDGTPRSWRNRPYVSLTKLERLLSSFFTPAPAESAAPQPSPTAGMNMVQRILHVGGRNPPGSTYVEFGSIQAVEALVKQVQRDLPRHQCRRLPDHEIVTMYAECPSSDAEMLDFAHELMDAMLAPTLPAEQVATTDDPGPLLDDDGRAMVANSHHYTPEDIRALVKQLRAFSDPQQTTQADWDSLDWRGHCNVLWRVMSALADEVVPAPLQQGEYLPLPECDATTIGLGAVWNRHGVRAAIDADRAARGAAQAAPAPVAEDADDAARYRWLREEAQYFPTGRAPAAVLCDEHDLFEKGKTPGEWGFITGKALDGAIDIARAKAAQPAGDAK